MENWDNSLIADKCAQAAKEGDNKAIMDYSIYNYFNEGQCDTPADKSRASLIGQYPNLRFKDGYGVANGCAIDADSAARIVPPTHGPEKQQLFARNFQAVPDFGRGCLNLTDTESLIMNRLDTRECGFLAERDFDRFTPLTPCMQKHVAGQTSSVERPIDTREMWRCSSTRK